MAGPWYPMGTGATGRGRLRASDADREQVIDTLQAAFVYGLLAKDELDSRAGRADRRPPPGPGPGRPAAGHRSGAGAEAGEQEDGRVGRVPAYRGPRAGSRVLHLLWRIPGPVLVRVHRGDGDGPALTRQDAGQFSCTHVPLTRLRASCPGAMGRPQRPHRWPTGRAALPSRCAAAASSRPSPTGREVVTGRPAPPGQKCSRCASRTRSSICPRSSRRATSPHLR